MGALNPADVRLIPPEAVHAHAWSEWRSESAARAFMPLVPTPIASLAERLLKASSDIQTQDAEEYRWMVQCDGQIVGTVAVLRPSWRMGNAEISYHLGAQFHGRGIGTIALKNLVTLLFSRHEIHHVWATVSHDNLASRRVLERNQFRHEGTLREHFMINGTHVDQCIYGILRKEWLKNGTG